MLTIQACTGSTIYFFSSNGKFWHFDFDFDQNIRRPGCFIFQKEEYWRRRMLESRLRNLYLYPDKQKRQHILLLVGLPISILYHWDHIYYIIFITITYSLYTYNIFSYKERQHILLLIGLPINILCHWEYIPSGLLHHKYEAWSSSQFSSQWKEMEAQCKKSTTIKSFPGSSHCRWWIIKQPRSQILLVYTWRSKKETK